MTMRTFFLLLLAYLAFDFADPVLPGAFSFQIEDSEIDEAVHVQLQAQGRQAVVARPTPERGARREESASAPRPIVIAVRPERDTARARPAPRSALAASALAPPADDH